MTGEPGLAGKGSAVARVEGRHRPQLDEALLAPLKSQSEDDPFGLEDRLDLRDEV
jgi:hypothetical protein